MTEIFNGIIHGELAVALLVACACMGKYLGKR